MTDSQLHTVARGWLEDEGLAHLLPEPHSHADVRACIAGCYPGGGIAFVRHYRAEVDVAGASPAVAPAPIPGPATPESSEPSWFNPPAAPVVRTCEEEDCVREFSTRRAYKRFCPSCCERRTADRQPPKSALPLVRPETSPMGDVHPVRHGVLSSLEDGEPRAVKDIARGLGADLGNVAYHVRALKKFGLIELVKTEERRGCLCHYYAVTARYRERTDGATALDRVAA